MATGSSLAMSLLCAGLVFVGLIQALPMSAVEKMRMGVVTYSEPRAPAGFGGNYRLSFGPYRETFEEFKMKYDKYYDSDAEEAYRFSIFKDNIQRMEKHNLLYHHGNRSYYQDMNHFTDQTLDEYREYNRLGRYSKATGITRAQDSTICGKFVPKDQSSEPARVDWRDKGKVTNVKDQGQCGSCWTFSTTGAVEGSYAISSGRLLSLSEQQIVDCCHLDGCSGCNGGFMDAGFDYVNKSGGLETEREYRYRAHDDACHFKRSQVKVHVLGCEDIASGDEAALKNAVAHKGPVSVAIDAGSPSFMGYAGGIYYNEECSPTNLDHGVLAIGYGSLEGQDYWLVKNSWSPRWGLNGYVLMSRNKNNNCGIATMASFPHAVKP